MKKFTPEEDRWIIRNRLNLPQKRMSVMLGRSGSTVRQRLNALGYSVPKEVAQRFAAESRIKPGNIPMNKGKRMSPEIRKKVKHTWFKKGRTPHNTRKDGDISIRADKTGRKYQYIRTQLGRWELFHRVLWQQKKGKIQAGMMVCFKNGNSLDCRIGNLKLITKAENIKKNSIHNWPDDIKKQKMLLAGFKRKLNRYGKDHQ